MKLPILIIFFFFILGCSIVKETKVVEDDNIKVVKFMYLDEYPIEIYPKSFWANKHEHAIFSLPGGKSFLDQIEALPQSSGSTFDFYNYAFVVTRSNHRDTIYADMSLRTWIFVKNGKNTFYYDKDAVFTAFLREQYPFFNNCW
jgi:hypothetical protein